MISKNWAPMQITRALTYVYFLLFAFAANAQTWKIEKQQSNIVVYSRSGNDGYAEVLAKIQLQSSLSALLLLLDDAEIAPDWIDHCLQIEIVTSKSLNERLVHAQFSAPWPLKKRDMYTFSNTYQDLQTLEITIDISDRGEQYPPEKSFVRMQNVSGQWHIAPLENGMVEISYQGSGDPAGNIPRWLANKLLISSTYTTFSNLKHMLRLDKYQAKFLSGIKEPKYIP